MLGRLWCPFKPFLLLLFHEHTVSVNLKTYPHKGFELMVLRNCAHPMAKQLCHEALSNYSSFWMKRQYNP